VLTKLETHPEVYEELDEARSWYDEHAPGLGKEFLNEAVILSRAISSFPLVFCQPFLRLDKLMSH